MDIRVHTVRNNCGFFSMLDTLLFTLAQSERDGIPTYVDWSAATNYLDAPGNLYDHFFEQPFGIRAENLPDHRIVETVLHADPYWARTFRFKSWYVLTPQRIRETSRLLSRYIALKPGPSERADAFIRDHLSTRTLAIHLRGTDLRHSRYIGHKPTPLISSYRAAVVHELKRGNYTHIYCASEDQILLDTVIRTLRECSDIPATTRIVTYGARRSSSGQSLHLETANLANKRELAEEVLVESLILSRCAFIIKSYSNVSNFAVFFNPTLPFFDIHSQFIERFRSACLLPKQLLFFLPYAAHRLLLSCVHWMKKVVQRG